MRPSHQQYFMAIVDVVATRSTCDRKHQGAVIVMDKQIVSTGYNGSPPGVAHCDEVGHDLVNDHCTRAIHAEINAVVQAAKHGVKIGGATLYCTSSPCKKCLQAIIAAGITKVIYKCVYDAEVVEWGRSIGFDLQQMEIL